MYHWRKFSSKAHEVMLHQPCLTAVDGFSFPDLTCALARCREDASNWAAFIYNTSCSTCLEGNKNNYVLKNPSLNTFKLQAVSILYLYPTQDSAAAEKEDVENAPSPLLPLHKPPATGWEYICFNVGIFKRNTSLRWPTAWSQCCTTNNWVYFSCSVISYAHGILTAVKSKHTLQGVHTTYLFFFFQEEGRKWNCPFRPLQISPVSPCFWVCFRADWLHWSKVKVEHDFSLFSLHFSAAVSAWSAGPQRAQIFKWDGTCISRFRSELHCTTNLQILITSPSFVVDQKTEFSQLYASKCILCYILLMCFQLLKVHSYKINSSNEKEGTVCPNAFFVWYSLILLLFDHTLTPTLCLAGWSDQQLRSLGFGTVTLQKYTGLGFLPVMLSDPEHILWMSASCLDDAGYLYVLSVKRKQDSSLTILSHKASKYT